MNECVSDKVSNDIPPPDVKLEVKYRRCEVLDASSGTRLEIIVVECKGWLGSK
jgi:hypothetical protein